MGAVDSTVHVVSSAGGQILRASTGLATLRRAAKPLHPRGALLAGALHRFGGVGTGAAWLDDAGKDEVLVRLSRAVGLPAPAPDVFGLALRVPTAGGDGYGDLLLASTGLGPVTRFTLTPARSLYRRPMTTLLPYRTPAGAVLLSAVFQDENRLMLAWAIRSGAWHLFAELVLGEESGEDETRLSFDPVRNVLPGMENYAWVRRLREPSYTTARRSRRS
jgi:hypothetical protein